MKRYLPLIPLAALAFLAACDRPTGLYNAADRDVLFDHSDDWTGGPLMGAIWNTDRYGTVVDGTVIFDFKRDVYLRGGPPPNAPATAAGLNDGMYVFQVTPPNAKNLLSEDPARCRVVRVAGGQIVERIDPTHIPGLGATSDNWRDNGNGQNPPCHADTHEEARHNTEDKAGRDAITVQLMPFLDTPNAGGVYKTSITPLAVYLDKGGDLNQRYGNSDLVRVRGQVMGYPADPGFGGARNNIKTDNFKVAEFQFTPPTITVIKFHDAEMTGTYTAAAEITGWEVGYEDPLGFLHTDYTRFTIFNADEGYYVFEEDNPAGTLHTVTLLGSTIANATAQATLDPTTVAVTGAHEETHVLLYGNVGLGELEVCKEYNNTDGTPISGWRVAIQRTHDAAGDALTGEDLLAPVTQYTNTEGTGCTTFSNLLPGDYEVTEEFPNDDWSAVGADTYWVRIVSELSHDNGTPILKGVAYYIDEDGDFILDGGEHVEVEEVTFINQCVDEDLVGFGTKGYWHNKNGQDELRPHWNEGSLRAYVNGLEADGQSVYDFSAGETGLQEISDFLVDNNSTYIQLEQQLLAFIFNTWIRVGNDGTEPIGDIKIGDDWVSISSIIDDALGALAGDPDSPSVQEMVTLIDGLNNLSGTNDNWVIISVISPVPCDFSYPAAD